MKQHVVILGAGYAGMLAALRLASRTRRVDCQITVINASDTFVERIRLHQIAVRQPIKQHAISALLTGKGIAFVQGYINALNPTRREVSVETKQGSQTIHYDQLLYALGSSPARQTVPGVDRYCYSPDPRSVIGLATYLPDLVTRGGTVIVVGGGLTGIETATEIAETYPTLHVRLITRGQLGNGLSEAGRAHLRRVFARLGISITEHCDVARVESDHLVIGTGDKLSFDVCVWTAGFSVPKLAADAGIKVNEIGQIIVDKALRSVSHPTIFAAGDSAVFTLPSGQPQRMACATAMPMGATAAANMAAVLADRPVQPFRFSYGGQCISLGRRNGLLQIVNPDDAPMERIVTGRLAALIKEIICRYTLFSLQVERHISGFYFWPKPSAKTTAVQRAIRNV